LGCAIRLGIVALAEGDEKFLLWGTASSEQQGAGEKD
jgi:hypothetical protein